jgi:nucleoside-triphosphatase THEP1
MDNAEQAHSIFLVTGSVQGGKTTFLFELVELLKKRGLSLGGFLAKGSFENGKRSAFVLHNIENGTELAMASVHETAQWLKYRRFWFNPDAFKEGMEWIRLCLLQKPDVLVIDEVGPMELEGSGWSEVLESLINSPVSVQLWSVRESLIGEVMEHWSISSEHLIRIDNEEVHKAANLIIRAVESNRNS